MQSQSQWIVKEALSISKHLMQTVEGMAQYILRVEVMSVSEPEYLMLVVLPRFQLKQEMMWLITSMVQVMSMFMPTLMKVEVWFKSLRGEL